MLEAIKEAKIAAEMSEIPVGAVIVKSGEIISTFETFVDPETETIELAAADGL